MKIITDCQVHLVSEPLFHPHPQYLLPEGGTAAERLIATAGKVCYDTYGIDGNPIRNHVQNLVAQQHYSVTEHAHVGVFVEGISRGCSHELVRHRHFNWSQRSTRYTAEDGAAIVLEPFYAEVHEKFRWDDAVGPGPKDSREVDEYELLSDFIGTAEDAIRAYGAQVEMLGRLAPPEMSMRDKRKWCRGKARQLLPHCLETRLVMTGNMLSWRQFFVKRTSRHAEPEMRRLAEKLYHTVAPIAPNLFFNLKQNRVEGYLEVVE